MTKPVPRSMDFLTYEEIGTKLGISTNQVRRMVLMLDKRLPFIVDKFWVAPKTSGGKRGLSEADYLKLKQVIAMQRGQVVQPALVG